MDFSLSVTFSLDDADQAVWKYCKDNQYDVPDYSTLIDRIKNDLYKLEGANDVVFDHSNWITFYLNTDNFEDARSDIEIIKEEIKNVFLEHGVKL